MTLPWFSIAVSFLAPFCPHPHDAHGWGLRVHNLSVPAPYLLGERITRTKFDVTLINFSKETREHDPLAACTTHRRPATLGHAAGREAFPQSGLI